VISATATAAAGATAAAKLKGVLAKSRRPAKQFYSMVAAAGATQSEDRHADRQAGCLSGHFG